MMLLPLLVALISAAPPEIISTNDMRVPAGKLSSGVLTLQLEVRSGMWYPDGRERMGMPVAAFAEVGRALQNPGPLVRVPLGTEVRISIRNPLDHPLWIFGLGEKRGATDSVAIAAGATHEFKFRANDAGVYYYAGKFTPAPLLARGGPDSQLNGMIVVDPPGAKPADNLFLISWWFAESDKSVSGLIDGSTMVINGLSWPHTKRIQLTQGERATFRWVNMTIVPHPLHLHGFYFDVTAAGDGAKYTTFAAPDVQKAVTNVLMPGATMGMSWMPERAGNWVMHCHFAGHMTSMEGMNKDRRYPSDPAARDKATHSSHHQYMEGLVIGLNVKPVGAMKASGVASRTIRLIARSKPNGYGEYAGYGYVLGGSSEEADAKAINVPGPLLVLKKNETVAINIINQTHEPAAVHWHGIELESFPDGVPGVSGYGKSILPPIPPGDSLTVQFTPPRAGTFMYHSHSNEFQQIASGMYGAIVVVEPGQSFNAETDKLFVVSDNGPTVNVMKGPYPRMLINGELEPKAVELKAGTTYRFRMVNIRADGGAEIKLMDGESIAKWRRVARDGADLPAHQAIEMDGVMRFAAGMILDFEFTPKKAGTYRLTYKEPPGVEGPPGGEVVLNVR
jgi:manganese oxidase